MSGRGVLVYGSLLHRPTLEATLSEATVATAVPVRVEGYRRSFNKPSAHREGENGETAILNAEPDADAWLNAVLVPGVPDDEFEYYRQREYRYDLVDVTAEHVEPYDDGNTRSITGLDERLIATSEGELTDPEPIPYYAAKCLEGARGWGETFLTDFLVTTDRL